MRVDRTLILLPPLLVPLLPVPFTRSPVLLFPCPPLPRSPLPQFRLWMAFGSHRRKIIRAESGNRRWTI